MQVQGFHHLALVAKDVERCAAFYREVLGLPELARHRRADGSLRSIWLGLGESPTAGFLAIEHATAAGGDSNGLGFTMLALRIDRDARAPVLAELAARGIRVERQTRWTVYFYDPEGHRVGLSHHPQDPPGEAGA